MSAESEPGPSAPVPSAPNAGITRFVRRIHLFLGLFLAPWMVMYALSTLVMVHRPLVLSFYPTETPTFRVEKELDYSRTFPPETTPREQARLILQDLQLEGRFGVPNVRPGAPLVINRQHALFQRRITFDPATRKLTIQREEFRGLTFLERLHRRRGFQDTHVIEDAWAFSVDLTAITLVFWGISGLWLWWGIRSTRVWGAICLATGLALFATCVALI